MTDDRSSSREKLIKRLEDLVREKFPADRLEPALAFVRLYYARVRMDLLESRELLDLYGAALAHLGLARGDAPGMHWCGSTTRPWSRTAGNAPIRWSRSSSRTCLSWWTRRAWR